MSGKSKWEYLKAIYSRYHQAAGEIRKQILDEFCSVCGYNRKYAIRLLNGPPPEKQKAKPRTRGTIYGHQVISILASVWEAAAYPWSVRLKALLPLWMPWIRKRFHLMASLESRLLAISPATIDRHLKSRRYKLKRKLYGRTKPGTLLKHHIPLKTENWDVTSPGFAEVDLVSHSGNSADGEFINYHLKAFCDQGHIQFTRSRPYKKDDNAHVEQKNWTHVRRIFGYVRYDSKETLLAMNDLYRNELRLFYNLYLPSVKLVRKERVGSRLKRIYDPPKTPFERLLTSEGANTQKVAYLKKLKDTLDPFELSKAIDYKLEQIYQMANHRRSPKEPSTSLPVPGPRQTGTTNTEANLSKPLSRIERETMKTLTEIFGIPVYAKNTKHSKKP